MPVYDYKCPECGTSFEETFRITEDSSVSRCPKCGGTAKKTPSLSNFHLKGGGWYADQYQKGKKVHK